MDDHAFTGEHRYGFGLTEAAVRRLQDILRREGEPGVTLEQAWVRAVELIGSSGDRCLRITRGASIDGGSNVLGIDAIPKPRSLPLMG